jgi:hypothetical protein
LISEREKFIKEEIGANETIFKAFSNEMERLYGYTG